MKWEPVDNWEVIPTPRGLVRAWLDYTFIFHREAQEWCRFFTGKR